MRPTVKNGKEMLISGSLRWPLKEGTFQLCLNDKDRISPIFTTETLQYALFLRVVGTV